MLASQWKLNAASCRAWMGRLESDYGWSLCTGRIRWSTVYATEREALEVTRKQRASKLKTLTDEIRAIDARIVKIAKAPMKSEG